MGFLRRIRDYGSEAARSHIVDWAIQKVVAWKWLIAIMNGLGTLIAAARELPFSVAYLLCWLVFGTTLFAVEGIIRVHRLLRTWRNAARQPFIINKQIYSECRPIGTKDENSPQFYEACHFIAVGNRSSEGKTLRHVQARLFSWGPPILLGGLDIQDGQIDIRHGEWAFFELGRLVSEKIVGLVKPTKEPRSDDRLRLYAHNVPRGYFVFEIFSASEKPQTGFGKGDPNAKQTFSLPVVISADDVLAKQITITIDLDKLDSPVSIDQPI